jgi:hypothetical protein
MTDAVNSTKPLLVASGVSKRFGAVDALLLASLAVTTLDRPRTRGCGRSTLPRAARSS